MAYIDIALEREREFPHFNKIKNLKNINLV